MLLCGLDAAASVLEFLALASSRAEGTGDAALCNDRFDHSVSNIVPGTLGNHSATHQPLSGAHSTRQVTQAIAQPSRVQFLSEILKQERVELTKPPILASTVAKVIPRLESRCHLLGCRDGQALVYEQFADRSAAPGFPIIVVAVHFEDDLPQLALAARRPVPNRVCDFVSNPYRK